MAKQKHTIPVVDLPKEDFEKYFKEKIKPLYKEKLFIKTWVISLVLLLLALGILGNVPVLSNIVWFISNKTSLPYTLTSLSMAAFLFVIFFLTMRYPKWILSFTNVFLSKKLKTRLFKAIDYEYYKGRFDLQEFQPVWDYFGLRNTTREIIFGKLHNKPFFVMLCNEGKKKFSILFAAQTNKPFSSEIALKEKDGSSSLLYQNKKLGSPKVVLQDFFEISSAKNFKPKEFFTKEFTTKLLEYKKKKEAEISVLFSSKYSEERNVYIYLFVDKIDWDYFDCQYLADIFKQSKYLSRFLKEIDRLLDIVATLEQK